MDSGPPDVELAVLVSHQDRFADRRGLVALDTLDMRWPEEMGATAPDDVLVGVGQDHRPNLGAPGHPPAFDVVLAVLGPQLRHGIGLTRIDEGSVRGELADDGELVLEPLHPRHQSGKRFFHAHARPPFASPAGTRAPETPIHCAPAPISGSGPYSTPSIMFRPFVPSDRRLAWRPP